MHRRDISDVLGKRGKSFLKALTNIYLIFEEKYKKKSFQVLIHNTTKFHQKAPSLKPLK